MKGDPRGITISGEINKASAQDGRRTALLISYPFQQAITEAISLAQAAGYSVVKVITQKEINKAKYGVGKGKAEEVKRLIDETHSEVIILDEVLKPRQVYSLASLCRVEIIDREKLILEIFERRASTTESRIQTKLAQLRYELARARDKVRLARAGEQPGFFGLGKYEADIYYLDIRRRATALKKKLEREVTRRSLYREQRSRARLKSVSLAGYTSAGKTTLFNSLTGESKATGMGLFTTLSTFTRAIELDGEKVLVHDTVGFVSKLPAYMIDAFKSTLDELKYADIVVLVLDVSEPADEIKRKFASSLDVINEFEVPDSKIIYVLNKLDLVSKDEAVEKARLVGSLDESRVISLSALNGQNTLELRKVLAELLLPERRQPA